MTRASLLTRLRLAEEAAVGESQGWMDFVLGAAGASVWELDLRGNDAGLGEIWWNMSGGATAASLPQARLPGVIPRGDLARCGTALQEVIRGKCQDCTVEHRVPAGDGSDIWIRSIVQVAERDPETGRPVRLRGVNFDITEARRQELRLRAEAGRQEARARALEAHVETFARALAGPLGQLGLRSGSLLADYGTQLPEDAWLLAERIAGNGQQLAAIVAGMARLAEIERVALRPRLIDLAALARDLWRDLAQAEPGHAHSLAIDPAADCTAWADHALLREALAQLLANALKFTRTRDRACVAFGVEEGDGERRYFVRDNGTGFDPARAGELFAPLVRLPEAANVEGTGIGLAAVRRIVERHGGRAWAEAAPGAGTTIRFTLPDPP